MKPYSLICLSLFLFTTLTASAQDIITFQDGSDIEVIVIEVTPDIIRYKKVEDLAGPTYSVNKRKVLIIEYSNGTTDEFEVQEVPQTGSQPTPSYSQPERSASRSSAPSSTGTLVAKGYKLYDGDRKLSGGEAKRILRSNSKALKKFKRGRSHKWRALGSALIAGGFAGTAIALWASDGSRTYAYYDAFCEWDYRSNQYRGCTKYRRVLDDPIDESLFTAGAVVVGLFSVGHLLIGKSRTRQAARLYNESYSYEQPARSSQLELGFAGGRSGGLSLTYKF